ncbi:hypothetical protein BS78_03G225200 [Paspalum vaginatum]|nr:hypothetical protein BS78_03G225200 [Paspalum vaginatum]
MSVIPVSLFTFLAAHGGCCRHCAHLISIPIGLAGFCSGQRWRRAWLLKLHFTVVE